MSTKVKLTKAQRAQQLVEEHVKCNVTGLISVLCQYNDDEALYLMGGEEDYLAYEVWCVSEWLAERLKRHEHRVVRCWNQHYWARGATGQSIKLDDVIKKIAEE